MADSEAPLESINSLLASGKDVLLATPEEGAKHRVVRHGFVLGEQHLMLAAEVYSEIASGSKICAIPDTPPWFTGFINNRGHTVPVYDLQHWLTGTPIDRRNPVYVFLFGQQPHTAGILLEQSPSVLNDPERLDQKPPAHYSALADFARAGYSSQGKQWLEIDHAALLNYLKNNFHQPVAKAEAQDNS